MVSNPRPPKAETTAPQDTDPSLRLVKWIGLRNTLDPEKFSPEELISAVNIDLDDAGQPHRRRGITKVADGHWSSLFNSDFTGKLYGVRDGVLGRINPDYSLLPLESDLPASTIWDPICTVQVGSDIYFSGRTNAGIINEYALTVRPWLGPNLGKNPVPTDSPQQVRAVPSPNFWYSPVVNPKLQLPPIRGRLLGPPPLARVLAYFNGRIYMAQGPTVWWTELYNYLYVDKTKNFWQFEADVTMIGTVQDGLYIGTEEGVWFITGHHMTWSADEARRIRVLDSGAIFGSMVYIPGELANPAQIPIMNDSQLQVGVLFMTKNGYCAGKDGGVCFNLTESNFVFPDMDSAAAMFRFQDGNRHYVVTGNSKGDPTANTTVGDHIDATIRRAGTWRETTETVTFKDEFGVTIIPA